MKSRGQPRAQRVTRSNRLQYEVIDHTFSNTALQTRIERIATKQRQKLRLARELLILLILIAQSLKSCDTTHGLARAGLDVIDVVVVDDAQVWRAVGAAAAGMGYTCWAGC